MMETLGWIGIFSPLALGALGSVWGSSLAGRAAIGAMLDVESGYGKFIALSAMPSSQIIYGIVLMFTLTRPVTAEVSSGLFALGFLSGMALWLSGIHQGYCCASAINISKEKPEVFGVSLAPAAIVEGFAVFIFVFTLVLAGNL
ncbi:ATP synthase subunit C [Flexibacterium corallicola]|uniref:ATP synthase subunit C n=1 Tax=Flexibacterium corallicola TaxID=3037259 RepID=UPI00286EF7E4|nr:ATP synthase subunit C [Pseudovibrio sp. M1P-2-3]